MTSIALDAAATLRAISEDVCEDVFRPPPQLTVSAWADENRVLPRTAAEPGRWRTDRVPYLRGVMDALGDDTVREVVFVKSAQVGGTSCGENFIGYLIDQAPCGILLLWPTEKKMRSWSRKQLTPLLEDTPALAEKFPKSGRRDASNTIAAKEFPGGFLQMLTAKSTSDLRSTSARVGIVEEVDEIDAEIGDQGDPLEQFAARFRTFWNSKQYKVSTPTVEGFSPIWTDWERSTQHRYVVPCPHCGHRQVLRWRDGKDDQDEAGAYRLVWETDDRGEVVPGSTCYACEDVEAGGCGATIAEHHKMSMLLAGEWVPTHPGRYVVGFHINTLYSPLCAWDDIARAFLKAKKSPATMQAFVNLWLGLPYREKGQSLDAHFLAQRAESYGPPEVQVPHGVAVLTAGVDVQGDRLEVAVWGWGAEDRSWCIAWEQLSGDPGEADVWAALDTYLATPMRHASGADVPILAVCVDSNYQADRVRAFCEPRFRRNIIPIIGKDGRGRKLIEPPKPDMYKRTKRERDPAYIVGTDTGKDLLAALLKLTVDANGHRPPGYVSFPETLDPTFYQQLTAEKLITAYKAGRPVRVWKPIPGRRNEALDLTIYARAALRFLTMGAAPKLRLADLAARAAALSAWTPPDPAATPAAESTDAPPAKKSPWGERRRWRDR